MLTMQPSLTIGSYTWAQDRLPSDEFGLRLDELHAAMDRYNWPAVLVYGDVRDHAALAYVSNFIPRVRWGMALLPRSGESRLLCAMSTRDLPAMRMLTWISDVRSGMGLGFEKAFDPWFERWHDQSAPALGTFGFDLMAPALLGAVRRGLGQRFTLRRADDLLPIPPRRKRPRELSMMRASCRLLDTATKAFVDNWRQSGAPETAALAAERVARSRAAQDVRTLVSLDGGRTLVPYQGRFEKRAGPLVGYLAVKTMGYWADAFVTIDARRLRALASAENALDALIAAVRPGVRAAEIYAAAVGALAPLPLHPVLAGSAGHGIGLSLNEEPNFVAGADAELVDEGIYTLQVGVADATDGNALLSAVVRNTATGAEVLSRSPAAIPA
ncbi:MAG: M24 family metallopeptidase [Xanthobacteraceae bacterium]